MTAHVFAAGDQFAFRREQSHRVHAAGFRESRLGSLEDVGHDPQHRFPNYQVAGCTRRMPALAVTASMEALPHTPQLDVV